MGGIGLGGFFLPGDFLRMVLPRTRPTLPSIVGICRRGFEGSGLILPGFGLRSVTVLGSVVLAFVRWIERTDVVFLPQVRPAALLSCTRNPESTIIVEITNPAIIRIVLERDMPFYYCNKRATDSSVAQQLGKTDLSN